MLELKNVCKSFENKPVLKNINMTVPDKGILCIKGPSGCGKTTLMRIITGLEAADSGEILCPCSIRQAVVFQEDRLLPWKTAEEKIIAVGVKREVARRYLELTKLSSDADKYPRQLSGGMRRRLSCARALAFGGDMYIFDEPLTGLDDELRTYMLELIRKETESKSVIMITHDSDAADILNAQVYDLSLQNNGGRI